MQTTHTTAALNPGEMIPATLPPYAIVRRDGAPIRSAYSYRAALRLIDHLQHTTHQPHYVVRVY